MLILDLFLIIFCAAILYYLFNGAMYVPTQMAAVEAMVELVPVQPGTKVVDLGSGDGRIPIAFARVGAEAIGIEVNPLLVWWSRYKISKLHLPNPPKILARSFWSLDFRQYDVIVLFGITHIMHRLEEKIQREAKPGTVIVSNVFTFKNLQLIGTKNTVSVYRI